MKAVVSVAADSTPPPSSQSRRRKGRSCYALSFAYGQRHGIELAAAQRVAQSIGVDEHVVFPLDLRLFGGSALTAEIDVPKDVADAAGIPVTYVPARNTIFLSLALGYAETREAQEIWIGVNAVDFSGYPDCRPEFLDAFQRVIVTGTRSGVEHGEPRLIAPLVTMSKADIIRRGTSLGVDYSLTHSCYDPDVRGNACGHCDSCILRKRGFEEAGVRDPTVYVSS